MKIECAAACCSALFGEKWLVNWMRQKRAAEQKRSAARQFVSH
jgi:hypothetical protein